jgi:hypothetical protein
MTVPTRSKRRARPRPQAAEGLPLGSLEDGLADTTHRKVPVIFTGRAGAPVKWLIMGRELTWEEQTAITDRHTTVSKLGRTEKRRTDSVAAMRDMLLAMIRPEECEPRLTADTLRRLRGTTLREILAAFGMDDDTAAEEEELEGESPAP